MNSAMKNMLRNRRQAEGRRQPAPVLAPGPEGDLSWFDEIPATFAYTPKDEHEQRQFQFMPPAFETNALEQLDTSHQALGQSLDASNPPDSDFYANGNKIRPWAHVRVPAYLAISEIEGVSLDEFQYGKLSSDRQAVPQFAGAQLPIDITPLIPEAEFTTFGAMTVLRPGEVASGEDAYLYG